MMARPGMQAIKNWATVDVAAVSDKRLVLISFLDTAAPRDEASLNGTLPQAAGFPSLDVLEDVISCLKWSFAWELKDWQRGEKIMLIAEAEPPVKNFGCARASPYPTAPAGSSMPC